MQGLNGDRGNAAIIVALMATVLFGVGALAIDAGAMLVRHTQLQSGADAAALAIAQQCATAAVLNRSQDCTRNRIRDTATDYLTDNLLGDVVPDVDRPELFTAYDGRAGRVTVTASAEDPVMFGWALGADELQVSTSAIARWGPLTAVDAVFPLAVCRGALDEALQEVVRGEDLSNQVTLWSVPSDPAAGGMLGECDGAPDALPLGWLPPDDPGECTSNVTLIPQSYFDVAPSDEPPTEPGCDGAIEALRDEVNGCDWGDRCSDTRRRVLAVYDAGSAPGGRHPAHALVWFQVTGMRLGDRVARAPGSPQWEGVCDPEDDTYDVDQVQCIRGQLFPYFPPDDGPILDPTIDTSLLPASIEDTTVLNVRLVD